MWQRIYTRNGIVRADNIIDQDELLSGYESLRNHCLKGYIMHELHHLDTSGNYYLNVDF